MKHDKTISVPARKWEDADHQEERVSAGGSLREQAKGFAQVARDAVNDCQRDTNAIEELQRRRNRSGQ